MTRLSETIEVPFSIDEAFRYTSNFANIEQWDPGVVASKKLTPGSVGVGTRFEVIVRFGASTTAMEYTVTRFEESRRITLEGEGGAVHAIDDIRFTDVGGATRIDYKADISLSGIAGLAQPFLGKLLERVGKKAMAGLKDALTAEPGAPERSTAIDLMDRLFVPGAFGFTRFGYEVRKKAWKPQPASLTGQTAVVTGATSGLGRVASLELANLGARVILVGRNSEKLEQAVSEISEISGNPHVVGEIADLSLMSEVRDLAGRLLAHEPQIHILINNAAVLPTSRSETGEGLETAFATDLLSPYLLTSLLIPRLQESAPARIINVLSGGMYLSGVEVNDLQYTAGKYDGSQAYARAKRGLMILTEHWAQQLDGQEVVVHAMHPGWADTPGVQDSLPGFHKFTRPVLRTPEQGADTIVWLAAAREVSKSSGKFWLDRQPHLTAILPGTAGTGLQRQKLIEELTRLAA